MKPEAKAEDGAGLLQGQRMHGKAGQLGYHHGDPTAMAVVQFGEAPLGLFRLGLNQAAAQGLLELVGKGQRSARRRRQARFAKSALKLPAWVASCPLLWPFMQ